MDKNKTGHVLSIWWVGNSKMKCSHYKNGIREGATERAIEPKLEKAEG